MAKELVTVSAWALNCGHILVSKSPANGSLQKTKFCWKCDGRREVTGFDTDAIYVGE